MSRTLLPAFTTHLEGAVMFLANMALVSRLDGQVFGFTSHDQDITYNGVTYEAMSSLDATEVRQSAGGGVDNLQIRGLLVSDRITDTDIRAGLYDGASVELFCINWADTSMGRLLVLTGTIGEINHETGLYRAEIRSLSQRLAQQIVELTSPTCRVRALGDERCLPPEDPTPAFDLDDFQHTRTVGEVVDLKTLNISDDAHAAPYFRYGRAVGLTGANDGLEREIKEHEADTIASGAADFNGTNQYLSHVTNSDLETGDVDFTFAGWVYLDTIAAPQVVLAKWSAVTSSQREYRIWFNDSNQKFTFSVWNFAGPNFADVDANSGSAIAAGQWYFVRGWHDSVNNQIGIQVNLATAVTTSYSSGITANSVEFRFGAQSDIPAYLNGRLQRWGFWKSAGGSGGVLTNTQHTSLFNSGSSKEYAVLTIAEKVALVRYWNLSGPPWVDSHASETLTDNNTVGTAGGVVVTATQIILQEAFPFAVEVGDTFMLEAGCDRTAETCRTKFGNIVNLAAEPHIPGVDQIQERGRR